MLFMYGQQNKLVRVVYHFCYQTFIRFVRLLLIKTVAYIVFSLNPIGNKVYIQIQYYKIFKFHTSNKVASSKHDNKNEIITLGIRNNAFFEPLSDR